MPDYAPVRTRGGSFVSIEVLPRGPERLTRTVDQLASWGSGTFEGLRLIAGRRGWVVRCRIDAPEGSGPELLRAAVARQSHAEQLAALVISQVGQGAEATDIRRLIHDAGRAEDVTNL